MPVNNLESKWEGGSLYFYEKTVGRSVTGDVLSLSTSAFTVGGTAQDIDFAWYATGSKSFVLDAGAGTLTMAGIDVFIGGSLKTAANVGAANTGVTAVEYGDARNHVTVLTVNQVDALTTADNTLICDGYLLYTLPAGAVVIDYAYMSMAVTATVQQHSDTPDVGLGTVIGTGAVATLDGTPTFENIITGQTANDANGTAEVKTALPTAGVPFIIAAGDAHTIHFNVADTWADDTSGDLTANIAGTVVLVWHFMA